MSKPFLFSRRDRLWVGVTLLGALCVMGCRDQARPLPTTYPVHGTVTDGTGKPVTSGIVRFQPEAEPSVTTVAKIGEDGAYSLHTMRDGLRAEGAVAGPNRVILVVTLPGVGMTSINYPKPYNVEAGENVINLAAENHPGDMSPKRGRR